MASTYTVKKNDTLYAIAEANDTTYQKLAAINDIDNPDLIYPGQVIKLTGTVAKKKALNSNKPYVNLFGLISNKDGELFATWKWDKDNKKNDHFDHYETQWDYHTGNNVWFEGRRENSLTHKYDTYSIPDNATQVRFRVRAVSEPKNKKTGEGSYWRPEWSDWKTYRNPPSLSGELSVTVKDKIITAEVTGITNNVAKPVNKVEFKLIKNKTTHAAATKVAITFPKDKELPGYASCQFKGNNVVVNDGEYLVCYRIWDRSVSSEWSGYQGPIYIKPGKSAGFTNIKAETKTSIRLKWNRVTTASGYEIEYATDKTYFDISDQTTSVQIDENRTEHLLTGLENGKTYYFRLRTVNDKCDEDNKYGDWSKVSGPHPLGVKPTAPTTWSSTSTAMLGEPIKLYWIHNAQDGSSQTQANVRIDFGKLDDDGDFVSNDSPEVHLIETNKEYKAEYINRYLLTYNPPDELEEGEVVTSVCELRLTSDDWSSIYSEGTAIEWSIQTTGVDAKKFSEYSTTRRILVYSEPSLDLSVTTADGSTALETIESFPFLVEMVPGPRTQNPTGYHLAVFSNTAYDTVDETGSAYKVNVGDQVYSKYFDVSHDDGEEAFVVRFSADNINLQNNAEYTIKGTVSMDSGLTASSEAYFGVNWIVTGYVPNAEITIDRDTLTATIMPYADVGELKFYKVTKSGRKYIATDEEIDVVWGQEVANAITDTEETVYLGILEDDTEVYYYQHYVVNDVENLTMSVYRREFDGTFTEIATGLDSAKRTNVTDPHPALDYARYRIVTEDNATGVVSYIDLPGVAVEEPAVVIQWDEQWSGYDIEGDMSDDYELAEPVYMGNMLKIPYNVDVADNRSPDVSLVEYIGRKRPVSYYGTQLGETATWSVTIPKEDKETLQALRRLSIWMGDVYVREPSGSGYWAKITVSFSQKHCDTTIPVSFDITRVEGGM